MTATDLFAAGFDFTDPDLNEKSVPYDDFRLARQNSPIHWIEQPSELRSGFAEESGTGYWAVTRHKDVSAISKDSKNWSTSENGAIIRFPGEMDRGQIELSASS